jgi:small subunit ribosomal protein S6
MRNYEIMFIVDPNMPEDEVDQLNGQVEALITEAGGTVENVEKLGRRRLAYEIQRHGEGFYVLFRVAADGNIVKEVERRFRVMDAVLRYLTVRVDVAEKKLEKLKASRENKTAGRGSGSDLATEQPMVG